MFFMGFYETRCLRQAENKLILQQHETIDWFHEAKIHEHDYTSINSTWCNVTLNILQPSAGSVHQKNASRGRDSFSSIPLSFLDLYKQELNKRVNKRALCRAFFSCATQIQTDVPLEELRANTIWSRTSTKLLFVRVNDFKSATSIREWNRVSTTQAMFSHSRTYKTKHWVNCLHSNLTISIPQYNCSLETNRARVAETNAVSTEMPQMLRKIQWETRKL